MFSNHNGLINRFTVGSPEQMEHTVMMVVLSIQQSWWSVGTQMHDMVKHGHKSRFVWGNKLKTYEWLSENKEQLYNNVITAQSDVDRLLAYLEVPGLGLPKAGFMCQLSHAEGGCLDVHNIRMYDLNPNVLTWGSPKTEKTRRSKALNYLTLCNDLGGCEKLWDTWCNHIASKDADKWADGHHVSAVHLTYLTSTYQSRIKEAV